MSFKAIVFLLGHQAGVGKDTLGNHLIGKEGFIRFAFADKLKESVADLYGFTRQQMYTDEGKNIPDERYEKFGWSECVPGAEQFHEARWIKKGYYTPREILQDFGQEQRARFPDIWADYVFRQIEARLESDLSDLEDREPGRFVVTDFRFPNEFTVARKYAAKLNIKIIPVKIVRPGKRDDFPGVLNVSETALNDFTQWKHILRNDGSIDDLYTKYKSLDINYFGGEMGSTREVRTEVSV